MEGKQEKRFVDEIVEALIEAQHPYPMFWLAGLHPAAVDPKVDFDKQRFLVNQRFELIFGTLPSKREVPADYMEKQLDARYCLLPQGTRKQWFDSFKKGVLPKIMLYQIGILEQSA
jgi:hypothetical protein